LHMHLWEFPFQIAKFMGGEYLNISHNMIYKGLRSSIYWCLLHYLPPQKSLFNQKALGRCLVNLVHGLFKESNMKLLQ